MIREKIRIEIVKVGGVVEELDSFRYSITLVDKSGSAIKIAVLGIERISSDIKAVNIDGVTRLFKSPKARDVDRPKEGEVDCLIGYKYAAFHPNCIQAIGHLLLLHNRFGTIIGGTHSKLEEKTRTIVQHVVVHHANVNVQMEDFYSIERLGVVCSPRCGSCKCVRRHANACHPDGKDMTIKEKREYKLIEEKFIYKPEQKRWEAGYPWIIDFRSLPDNQSYDLRALIEINRETSQKISGTCQNLPKANRRYDQERGGQEINYTGYGGL